MDDVLFRSARIVQDGQVVVRDVAVRGARIERIGESLSGPARSEMDCQGLALLPGAIDLHVHLREPGLTHKEDLASGTRAAVASGVTTVLEMPNTSPATTTLERLVQKAEIASRSAVCHVRFYLALTADNLSEIERASSHPAFAGVKVFLGSTTGRILVEDPAVIERALDRVPCLFTFHAELESVLARYRGLDLDPHAANHHRFRPAEATVAGARLVAGFASHPGRRVHLAHLSSREEVEQVRSARPGASVTCEVTPHHLFFNCDDVALAGNRLKVNPPVRTEEDRLALLQALQAGVLDAVATDHAPHTVEEKDRPYPEAPSGVPGLDTLVPAVLRLVQERILTLPQAVAVLSERPAQIAGLRGKGRVAEGFDADLILCDPDATWTPSGNDIRSRCGWTPFAGRTLAARPLAVWVGGSRVC